MKIHDPYSKKGNWYKGNLHVHSTPFSACAQHPTLEVITEYRRAQYDFLCLTEHDHSFRLPYEGWWDDLVIIPGYEMSNGSPHIVCVGAVQDAGKRVVATNERQQFLDRRAAEGAITIMAHPHWLNTNYQPDLEQLSGYTGIEILNSSVYYDKGQDGHPDFWDEACDVWDMLLSKGRRVWGFGNDDMHSYREFDRSWNVVKCATKTPDEIIKALASGSFCVSTGVRVRDVFEQDDRIVLALDNEVEWKIYLAFGKDGQLLDMKRTRNATYEYRVSGDEGYVRLQALYGSGKALFTQPFFIE